ncbi:MAG: DUF58 domain-containing protein [Planctomycetaceae bacterium]
MIFRPGHRFVMFAGMLAGLSLGVFLTPAFVVVPLTGLGILVAFAERDRRSARRMIQQMSVTRTLPVIAARGLAFQSTLTVTNGNPQAVRLELRDVVPADCDPAYTLHACRIAAGEKHDVAMSCRIDRRGLHEFGPVWIRAIGPHQLFEVQRAFDCPGKVRVLPETFASSEKLVKDTGAQLLLLDKVTRSRQHGTGTEFESLHAYRDGDDPRRIDWRATARMRQPIVRRFQVERHRDVMILIDSGRLMASDTDCGTKLDCAVDAALNLARVALQSGDRCGVAAYDNQVRGFLPPVSGIRSLSGIVESVYDLQTDWKESDFTRIHAELQSRQSRRSFIVVLSDLSDAETSRLQSAALQSLSRRHLVLFAAVKTPLLDRILREPTNAVMDGAKKAVTYRLLRDRSRALHVLERAGVFVLDVEPQQITLPLINRFVDLRQRNLL